jgi:TRAP-type C4-dicarboxylate transport system permease small subunit
MNRHLNYMQAVLRGMDFVAGFALILIMLLTSLDVILRYLGHPIQGSYDMVGLGGAFILGFALPRTSWDKGHITVDIFTEKLSKKIKIFFDLITRCLGAFIFFLLGWNLAKLGASFFRTGDATMMLGIPLYPAVYALMVCAFAEFLVLVLDLGRVWCSKEGSDE